MKRVIGWCVWRIVWKNLHWQRKSKQNWEPGVCGDLGLGHNSLAWPPGFSGSLSSASFQCGQPRAHLSCYYVFFPNSRNHAISSDLDSITLAVFILLSIWSFLFLILWLEKLEKCYESWQVFLYPPDRSLSSWVLFCGNPFRDYLGEILVRWFS